MKIDLKSLLLMLFSIGPFFSAVGWAEENSENRLTESEKRAGWRMLFDDLIHGRRPAP